MSNPLARKFKFRDEPRDDDSLSHHVAHVTYLSNLARRTRAALNNEKLITTAEPAPRPWLVPVEKWFLVSDIIVVLLAFVQGGLAAWAVNKYLLGTPLENILSETTVTEMLLFLGMGVLALLWLDSKGHYRQRLPYWETIGHVLTISLLGFMVGGFIQFATKIDYSRLWLGFSWFCFAIMLFIGRGIVRQQLHRHKQWKIKALVVGNGVTAAEALHALKSERHMGYVVVGALPGTELDDLAQPGAWRNALLANSAQHVFLALDGSEIENHPAALKALVYENIPYSIFSPWNVLPSSTLSPHYFFTHDVMLMHNTNRLRMFLPRVIKRSFDILVSGFALVVLALPILALALLIKRDGGPAFYSHKRIGRNGKSFRCLKFRSMAVDGDKILMRHFENNPDALIEWEQTRKLQDDPRVTKIGKFIRRTSLDELPQLLNVIRGDMSLVGPRPIVVAETQKYDNDITLYHMVRPGITGLWQVSGRNDVSYAQRVGLDSWYVRNWSFWHDIAIICKTIPILIKRTGAY